MEMIGIAHELKLVKQIANKTELKKQHKHLHLRT